MIYVTPMIDSISCEYAVNLATECIVIVHVNIVNLDKHFNDLQLFLS